MVNESQKLRTTDLAAAAFCIAAAQTVVGAQNPLNGALSANT
jgi:hypothetical protein